MEANGNEALSRTLLQSFEEQVRKNPNKIAVTAPHHRITYKELDERAETISHRLLQSPNNNTFAAILLPQGVEFISSVFGIFKSGLTAAPFSIDHSRTQIKDMLEDLNEPLICTTSEYTDKLPAGYNNILLVSDEDLTGQSEAVYKKSRPSPNPVAFCIFTSGSTGRPKGVLIADNSVVQMIFSNWHMSQVRDTDKTLGYSSPAFILSFREYLAMLLTGGSLHVAPPSVRQDMDKLHEFINEQGITILALPTATANKMMTRKMPTVRWLLFGGEKQTVEIPDSLTFKINYAYGLTETLSIAANPTPTSGVPHNGKPVRGVQVYILDSELNKVQDGEVGEVCIESPTLALGYLNNPKLTAERFFASPFNPDKRFFRTGDLGNINADGDLVITGRADFQVKIMGNRIELAQVEVALMLHPGIKEAAVIPVRKGESNTLTAFYVPSGSELPDYDELSIFLEEYLPRYGIPTLIVPIAQLPMTSSGKVNRVALREIEVIRSIDPPVTPTQIDVANIWSQVLGIPLTEIGLKDTFFSLGGNSLQMALVVTKLQGAPHFLNLRTIHLTRVPRLDKFAELVDRFKIGNFAFLDEAHPNDYDSDSSLPNDFPKQINLPKFKVETGSTQILLTGSTGYVGANFIGELLKADNRSVVTCLIRADSNDAATKRLEQTLKKYGLDPSAATDIRVICLAGDVSKPFLGLNLKEYNKLCTEIDVVYHIAAEVHWLKYYSELRESNILGTKRVLKFATQEKLKFLHYISTLGVIGGGCKETEILESPDPLLAMDEQKSQDNGYSQTKRIAEKLIWAAIDRGFPAIVYRLGEIGCHSQVNVVNKSDFLARFFTTCKKIGCYPTMHKKLPYGTIDFTCKSMIRIAQDKTKWTGKCFNLFEKQMSYMDGLKSISGLKELSMQEWTAKLAEVIGSSSDPQLQEEYSILLQLIHNQSDSTFSIKNFSQLNTKQALKGSEVPFNLDQDWKRYLELLFEF